MLRGGFHLFLKIVPVLTTTHLNNYSTNSNIPSPILVIEVETSGQAGEYTLAKNQSMVLNNKIITTVGDVPDYYSPRLQIRKELPNIRAVVFCELFRKDKYNGRYSVPGLPAMSADMAAYTSHLTAHVFTWPDLKYIESITETAGPPLSIGSGDDPADSYDNGFVDGIDTARNELFNKLLLSVSN